MESVVNRVLDVTSSREAAMAINKPRRKKKSLRSRVCSIVREANKEALPERRVAMRYALMVMDRSLAELSSLDEESRELGVIREVNRFLSLNQNTVKATELNAKHTDLLEPGHPLSDKNNLLSEEEFLHRYSVWLSADKNISNEHRALVSTAYSQKLGSVQREHAFIRLRMLSNVDVPAFITIDHVDALVAAFRFGDGNSSAARRARVKLQWRDRFGKWIEMGRGINFKFRLPDGGTATGSGTYVGSDASAGYSGNWARKEANNGLVEVRGNAYLPDGIYSINNSNAESFKARLSEEDLKRAGVDTSKKDRYKVSSQFDKSIPDVEAILVTKVDAPSGWKKNKDGSFTSDDDYKAIPTSDGYTVHRLDPEGKTGDKVGDAKTWADVQNIAAEDEQAYDKYKEDVESGQLPLGDGKRPEPRYSKMNKQVQQEIKQLKDQIPKNEEVNKRIETQLKRALTGKDSQGRDLPDGWYSKINPDQISETYYKDIPGATRKDEYLVALVSNDGTISYGTVGFWFDEEGPTKSWDKVEENIPKIIDKVNQGRASIGLDPIGTSNLDEATKAAKSIPSTAQANPPALYEDFIVPNGAHKLASTEYEPVGRTNERSTDFTDDPNKLATKFDLRTLVTAFTKSLVGDVNSSAIDDVLKANVDSSDDLPDFEEVSKIVDTPVAKVLVKRPNGAGKLTFNSGEEYVPANALYNAVWMAGGDPNRVMASAYDTVNLQGNRENIKKLISAQGGEVSPEDSRLISDIVKETKQINDATPEGDVPVANETRSDSKELAGKLHENVNVDFGNPDYYKMDLDPYIPIVSDFDENGNSDDPKIIALSFTEADLIQQLQSGIKDGSGAAILNFQDSGTDAASPGFFVAVEGIRDALQYQGVNTNDLLFKIRDEFNSSNVQVENPPAVEKPQEPTPTPAPAPEAAPTLMYPGPRRSGYSAENTTIDSLGNVMAAGSKVRAIADGKSGVVVSIQNDPEYVRIKFDDGKVAVRSAFRVRAVTNPDGSAPSRPSREQVQAVPEKTPADVEPRLNQPLVQAPKLARSGETYGVNDMSTIPSDLADLVKNKNATQADYVDWGTRDAEIAKAAKNRPSLDSLLPVVDEYAKALADQDREKTAEIRLKIQTIASDIFGARQGVSFGSEFLSLNPMSVYVTIDPAYQQGKSGKFVISANFSVKNQAGATIGRVERELRMTKEIDLDGKPKVSGFARNAYLKLEGAKNKKHGFASGYNRYMENWYIANGIKDVKVYAAGGQEYQGGFVWALNGFGWDPNYKTDIKNAIDRLGRRAGNRREEEIFKRLKDKLDKSLNKETNNYDLSKAPTPMEVALAGWTPGAKDWIGKNAMISYSWNGIKKLEPGAREQTQGINYKKIKAAEKRIETKQNKPNVSGAFLAYISSNDFESDNREMSNSISAIRSAIKNNDSLAVLSQADKVNLNNFVTKEMYRKTSKVDVEDLLRLRTALNNEYRADYYSGDPSLVIDQLAKLNVDDFENGLKMERAGFDVLELDSDQSGINVTWLVTHRASGQVFYVKNDETTTERMGTRGAASEVEANVIFNVLGIPNYQVRLNNDNKDLIIMTKAGATLPVYKDPVDGWKVQRNGIPTPSGGKFYGQDSSSFFNAMKSPEDALGISIVDTLLGNEDRHPGNWQVGIDETDGKVLIFPIDHTYTYMSKDDELAIQNMEDYLGTSIQSNSVAAKVIPEIVSRAGKDRAYKIFENQAKKIISNIDNELYAPKGEELAALIDKWGTYDAFKDAIKKRVSEMIKKNSELNKNVKNFTLSVAGYDEGW